MITVKPGASNEMLWSPGVPIFLSWSSGAPHILGLSPGALPLWDPDGKSSLILRRDRSHTAASLSSCIQRPRFGRTFPVSDVVILLGKESIIPRVPCDRDFRSLEKRAKGGLRSFKQLCKSSEVVAV